jgi:hypothetical protein
VDTIQARRARFAARTQIPILLLSKRVSLARPAARSARASRNLRTDLQFSFERSARKKLRGNESEAQHALPDDGKRAKGEHNDATQAQMRSQVDHRSVSGQVRRAELPNPNQRWRPRLLSPERPSHLRLWLRSWRKGRTRFRRAPDRRRRLLSENQGTKNGGSNHVSQQSDRNRQSWR